MTDHMPVLAAAEALVAHFATRPERPGGVDGSLNHRLIAAAELDARDAAGIGVWIYRLAVEPSAREVSLRPELPGATRTPDFTGALDADLLLCALARTGSGQVALAEWAMRVVLASPVLPIPRGGGTAPSSSAVSARLTLSDPPLREIMDLWRSATRAPYVLSVPVRMRVQVAAG